MTVRSVAVYENYAPGAVVKLTAFDAAGKEVVAWEGNDPTPRADSRGVLLIPVRLNFPVKRIKLYLDSEAVPDWNEIDAVGLQDTDGETHWAIKAEASTTYAAGGSADGRRSYGPEQATGEPDIAMPGDQSAAWASATPDGQAEWLALEFETPANPAEIVVYENNAPGAITKIGVFDNAGKETIAWEGRDPTPRTEPWGVSVFPVQPTDPIRKVKLYLDSAAVPGWNEIDAVGLRSANGRTQWARSATASSTFGVMASEFQDIVIPAPDPQFRELAEEVKRLKEQVDELQKFRDAIQKSKGRMSDSP
jgi:hypothetical protein